MSRIILIIDIVSHDTMSDSMYSSWEMKVVLIASCAGVFLMPLMSTMMNLALVPIGIEFDVGSHSLAMVSTIFLLASVIFIVPVARISDIYGRKRVFVIGLIVTAVSAAIAAFSPSFEILLIMRFIMGAGSAAISVSSMSLLTDVFPFSKRGWAIGVYTTFVYLGIALGPAMGGFISDLLGWRSLFFFMIPLALVALFCISMFRKEMMPSSGSQMDIRGSVLYGMTILLMMYGVINLPQTWAVILTLVGIMLLFVFISYLKREESPVLDIGIFRYRTFTRSSIASFMNYASSYSVSFFMALYLQNIGLLSASQAGAVMLIQPIVQVLLTAKAGSYSDGIKDKRIFPTAGMALTSVGVFMIIFLGPSINFYYVAVILFLLGLGYALFSAPNTSNMMSSVPVSNRGAASGMVTVVRQIGMMTSMGVAMCCISLIMGAESGTSSFEGLVSVIQAAFTICFAMCLVGTLVSWFGGNSQEFRMQG